MKATFEKIMGDIRPQAAYFSIADGQRTLFLIVEVNDAADMPRIAEPLWLALKADVEVYPAMDVGEFDKAGPVIGEIVSKY